MRETKQITNSFTFRIVSRSLDLKAFDVPLGIIALLRLQSFTRVHYNPWNYHQMQRLRSALLHPVSLVFSLFCFVLLFFVFDSRTRHCLSLWFPASVFNLEGMSLERTKESQTRGNATHWTFNVGFRKCFISETALFSFSQVAIQKWPLFFGFFAKINAWKNKNT